VTVTSRSGRLRVTPELQVPGGQYLSAGDTRQAAERILARDQAGC